MPPKIDPHWQRHYAKLIKIAIAVVVALILAFTLLKGCTQMGQHANSTVYTPTSDAGFVGKTNRLLAYMVAKGNTEANPKNIDELNSMYPGLTFALPHAESDISSARVTDIRLVDIDPEQIDDSHLRMFFHNSDLPRLLAEQRRTMATRIFRLRFRRQRDTDYRLRVDSIYIVPSMFKVALEKTPWQGRILADDGSLFEESRHCFLSWGDVVLPLRRSTQRQTQGQTFSIDTRTQRLNRTIDPLKYHAELEAGNTQVVIKFDGQQGRSLKFDYPADTLIRIKAEGDILCLPYNDQGLLPPVEQSEAAHQGSDYAFTTPLLLRIVHRGDSTQIAEMHLTHHNPALLLSTPVATTSGHERYTAPSHTIDRFTHQVVNGLTTALTGHTGDSLTDIRLSLDPLLSRELESQLESYYRNTLRGKSYARSTDEWELSLTVMDMATGQVIAAPYYRSADRGADEDLVLSRKNPALTRRYIGSAFKPMLALAAVQTERNLLDLDTRGKYSFGDGKTGTFFGSPVQVWAKKASSHWAGRSGMVEFIAASDDVYPVALATLALNGGSQDFTQSHVFQTTKRDIVLRSTLDEQTHDWTSTPFIRNIDALYGVKSYDDHYAQHTDDMDYYLWRHLGIDSEEGDFGLDIVTPEAPTMHYETFFGPARGLRATIVPWILGQGSNDWNTIKLAEAWTHMLTKRQVMASFIASDTLPHYPSILPQLAHPETANNVWNVFLDRFASAQNTTHNLLTPMYRTVAQLNESKHLTGGNELILFSKTGTPDNYSRREYQTIRDGQSWLDIGLYCMALMPRHSLESVKRDQGGSGLMCVVRITRITHQKPTVNGVGSGDARNLFSSHPVNLERLYTLTEKYLK